MALATVVLPVRQRSGFRLLRHATLVVELAGKKILVDPMLSSKGAMDPIANARDQSRIPMVDLPVEKAALEDLLQSVDAVLLTHTHRDHWDQAAQQALAKDTLIFCQPADEEKIRALGFTRVVVVTDQYPWGDLTIHRTGGQHGTGDIGKKMGTVSGYVLEAGAHRIYIAGDTIWCEEVAAAIAKHAPTQIILNGGGAQFLTGDPITMTIEDIITTARAGKVPVYVVHLETINHCYQRRADIQQAITAAGLQHQVVIPADGEELHW